MTHQPTTFPSELGIATRVGLTRGVGTSLALSSFAEAETMYRQRRLIEDAQRRRQTNRRPRTARSAGTRREGVSRWMTWLPSVPMHRSSPVPQSSTGCAN